MNFKKLLAVVLALIMCASVFAACDSDGSTNDESNKGPSAETVGDQESNTSSDTESSTATPSVEDTRFNYFNANMADYISIAPDEYNNIPVSISAEYQVSDATIKSYIDAQLFENRVKLNDGISVTDKPIKLGDSAFIYYRGTVDGVEFEGGSNWDASEPTELGIGSGKFIPGFEEGLIGVIPAETSADKPFALHVTFPETYGSDLAGKDAIFYVRIVYTVQYELPEYTEDFIINTLEFVPDSTDVKASFEASIKEQLEAELAPYRETAIQNAMWTHVLSNTTVESFPEGEVDYFYNSYLDQYEYYMEYYKYYGYSFNTLDEFVIAFLGLSEGADWMAETRKNAETDVTQNMIFHYIAQAEDMIITDTDYQAALQYYVDYYKSQTGTEYSAEEIEAGIGSRMIKEHALFTKVTEFLINNCTVTYK